MSSSSAFVERPCPIDDCDRLPADDHLMCRRHWFMVPKELRDEVWAAWRLRCDARDHPERYAAARDLHERMKAAAIRAVNEQVNPSSQAYETPQDQQIHAALRDAVSHLGEADAALCQVAATIEAAGGPALAKPWHDLIHQIGTVRDKVAAHVR